MKEHGVAKSSAFVFSNPGLCNVEFWFSKICQRQPADEKSCRGRASVLTASFFQVYLPHSSSLVMATLTCMQIPYRFMEWHFLLITKTRGSLIRNIGNLHTAGVNWGGLAKEMRDNHDPCHSGLKLPYPWKEQQKPSLLHPRSQGKHSLAR